MINAGIVGLGWWGRTLVEAVSNGQSDEINFVAGAARTHTDDLKAFAKQQKFELYDSYEKLLNDPKVDAVVLATPHSLHVEQVVAGRRAQEARVLRETVRAHARGRGARGQRGEEGRRDARPRLQPPLASRDDEAAQRRSSPASSATILHVEATMTFPNALLLKPDAWRADREETPCGGLTPMGVHAIDGMIDLCGPSTRSTARASGASSRSTRTTRRRSCSA